MASKQSWKGMPVSNLVTAIQNYASEGTYWVRVNDNKFDFYLTSAYNSWCVRAYAGAYTTGKTYTFSFQYRGDNPASGDLTLDNDGAENNVWNDTLTTTTEWQTYTQTRGTAATAAWYMYFRRNGGGNIYIRNVQLEESSFATPFVNGTRSNTEAIIDWAGKNTITASSLTYNSDGTFGFNGSNNGMTVPGTNFSLNTMTIEAWAYSSNFAHNGFIFEKTTNGSVNTQYSFFCNTSSVYYRTYGLSTSDLTVSNGSSGLVNNQWNHMVATFDGTYKKIYVNGVLKATSGALTGTVTQNTTGNAYIGIYGSFAGYPFNGKISSEKIYNHALTAAEIQQNFSALRGRYSI